jgi:peptidoglycan-associated lipoprotein
MKMNQLVFPLVFVLAATLAATGCKKGPVKTTIIPGHNAGMVPNPEPTGPLTPGPGLPITPEPTGPGTGPVPTGGGPLVDNRDEFDGMIKDPAALAAYTVHFKYDSAVVQTKEQANIASVAQALTSSPNDKLLIEGNCDERGTQEYNRALGERRALALREALAKNGIDPARIRTISYGKDKPVDPGHDETAFAKNRRGDFILLHPKAGV